jgi:hypothetical protein
MAKVNLQAVVHHSGWMMDRKKFISLYSCPVGNHGGKLHINHPHAFYPT